MLVNVAGHGGDLTKAGRIKPVNEAAGTRVNLVGRTKTAATEEGQPVMVDLTRFNEEIVVPA